MDNVAILQNVLRKVKIFNHIPQDVIIHLSKKMHIKPYANGEEVFKKGDIGDYIYVIVSGSVKLHDQDMTIAEMGENDFFGEFSLLDNEPRSLSVTCTSSSKLAALHRDDFYQVLHDRPESTKNIIEALIKRIREQNNKIFLFLKSREKELAEEVAKKTSDLREKNNELQNTLEKLKVTQQQLVMKEMLASMGQITAGIAHTIKNPLNFVQNFSELCDHIILEINLQKDDHERIELLKDLKLNIEKVNSHARRANGILENMLQHSVIGTAEKHPVDLNELAEVVASIAYKSYQSVTPGFVCEIQKEFDSAIPRVMVSTKEISRVFLNLLNNAFYAVEEKKKENAGIKGFNPVIKLKTLKSNAHVIVSVNDNGTGIAKDLKEKIFEPFFTTKPPAHGNGLGLSMTNEIIKTYGGEIRLKSNPGNGAEFSIYLPV